MVHVICLDLIAGLNQRFIGVLGRASSLTFGKTSKPCRPLRNWKLTLVMSGFLAVDIDRPLLMPRSLKVTFVFLSDAEEPFPRAVSAWSELF